MVISCLRSYNLVSNPKLYKKLFCQIGINSNVEYVGKLAFRKHLHCSAIRWTKSGAAKILNNKTGNAKNISRLLSLARPEKYKLAAAIGLLVISSGVTMSIPFAMGKVIDIIYSMDQLKTKHSLNSSYENIEESLMSDSQRQSIMNNLQKVSGILMGVFMVGALANFGRVYLMRMISQNVASRIRKSLYSSIGNLQDCVVNNACQAGWG